VQAKLTALLVDNPQLASAAIDAGLLEHVQDPRLLPIAKAVLESANQNLHPSEGELLELIEARARRQVHDAVFSGTYRDTELDPEDLLTDFIRGCQRRALERERDGLLPEMRDAQERGDMDRVLELGMRRLALGQQLADELGKLRQRAPSRNQA
jgi:hypothetical protein